MTSLLRLFRFSLLGLWLLWGVLLALVFLRVAADQALTSRQQALMRWWSGKLLQLMGIQLYVQGEVDAQAPVWVSNHASWLDIMVIMAVQPCRFLSKAEVAHWPIIGWLATRAGTVYLQRGHGETEHALHQLTQLIHAGDRVLFFPEGTTYAQEPGLFHARLFAVPIALQYPIQPVMLCYQDAAQTQRPDIAYVGDQSLGANLWHLLAQRGIRAQVVLLPAQPSVGLERKQLAKQLQQQITFAWHRLNGQP